MGLISTIKSNSLLKKVALWMLTPPNEHRPRLWTKIFLNPFIHKRGKGSIIRGMSKIDLFPFNNFTLGKHTVIEHFSTVNNGVGDVTIGEYSFIGTSNVIIGPVIIGNRVMTAQNVVISGMNHSYKDVDLPPTIQPVTTSQITIADNVWIGANCVIIPGISIGHHSVIGAGSVVTKDIPDYCVAVGNPARLVKRYNHETKLWDKLY
jgi:acetyltransferase-like isoleucine patch superfamily enzyme